MIAGNNTDCRCKNNRVAAIYHHLKRSRCPSCHGIRTRSALGAYLRTRQRFKMRNHFPGTAKAILWKRRCMEMNRMNNGMGCCMMPANGCLTAKRTSDSSDGRCQMTKNSRISRRKMSNEWKKLKTIGKLYSSIPLLRYRTAA